MRCQAVVIISLSFSCLVVVVVVVVFVYHTQTCRNVFLTNFRVGMREEERWILTQFLLLLLLELFSHGNAAKRSGTKRIDEAARQQ